jgi:CRISPR-associated endonuclease/helicase Cas3
MDKPVYFGRSREEDPDPVHWQVLEDHLHGVASRAAQFAEAFGSRESGYLAGLWHDLGKYQSVFQDKLRGAHIGVEHSGAGAALAFQVDRNLGMPLAFVIAGHHGGLANWLESGANLPSPLQERVENSKGLIAQLLPCIPSPIAQYPMPPLPVFLAGRHGLPPAEQNALLRRREFWVRFLFSALVDADRLDAESFLEPAQVHRRGGFEPIEVLRERLDAHIDGKVAELTPAARSGVVNQARAQVLAACRDAAAQPQGIFSLTVPTGGGKTLSAMSFALRHAAQHRLRRVIGVIPYTSIIEQNAQVYRQALGGASVVEHHSSLDPAGERAREDRESSQRHELACENWDAPVIVTTSVQFFESLFANHPSRCRKLHNTARSVVILDEVQTIPPAFLLSILDALNELVSHYGCSVVLSTATPPALAAREGFEYGLADIQPIVANPKGLAVELKRVEYEWPDLSAAPVEWPDLAKKLARYSQVLAVVHRRNDARVLTQELQQMLPGERIFHLSALMCPAHRSAALAQIKESLSLGRTCHVVSTQLVEAGVDLDFPVVYRALGGLDSMVQAAGRCNREGRREKGQVVVFCPPTSPPPGTPRRGLEVMASLLRENGGELDLDDPAIFEIYFRKFYFATVQDARNIQAHRQQFNFATVGQEFRLIEDGFTYTLVVPYGEAAMRLEELRQQGPSRATLRALQPFLVNIYPDSFNRLFQAGALEQVVEGVYALSRVFAHHYDGTFGLMAGDEPQADPSVLVV